MSITVETLATKRVIDTRTDVNSYARRTYQIFDGPQDSGYVKFHPNGANGGANGAGNQINFTLNPPSTRVFVNRRVVLEAKFIVEITGIPQTTGADGVTKTNAANGYLINMKQSGAIGADRPFLAPTVDPGTELGADVGTCGPRAYPLANATQSLQVNINNDQLSQNLGQYWRATTRYANSLGQSEIDQGSTATMLDMAQSYAQTKGNALSPFMKRGSNPLQTSRTGIYEVKVLANPKWVSGAAVTARLEFTVREPLYLSPFLFQRGAQDTGLIGVQTLGLQLQLGGRGGGSLADAIFCLDSSAYSDTTTVTAVTQEVYCYMNFLTPDALQVIPDVNNYPYYEPVLYTTTNNAPIAAGDVTVHEAVMNNIQLNSIPQRLLIFIDEPDSAARAIKSDTYAAIENINISFDNRDSLLAAAQPIDLYNIAAKNNTNLTWAEWSRDCGSVLCLNFGEDIPLRANQAVGLRGSYNLRMTVRFRNVKSGNYSEGGQAFPLPMAGYTLSVVVFSVGVMTIAQQNVVRTTGILTNEDVLRSKEQPATPYVNTGDIYGGGWFDDFARGFMSVMRPAASIASKILPMLAPETAPFVGAFNSIINPEQPAGPGNTGLVRSFGNGLVGGNVSGGRLVGGKKVTRAQLAKMMR
jgi:hypothetical protein